MEGDEFKSIETITKTLLKTNPAALAVEALVSQAAKLIAKAAMNNKDDQIGVINTTFIHKLHNIDDFVVTGEACGDARLTYSLRYL